MTSPYDLGQFETPLDVADLLLGFALHKATDRVLDPACGEGTLLQRARAWQTWLAPSAHDLLPDSLVGVELDEQRARRAGQDVPAAKIIHANFFTLQPGAPALFDAVVGNPPYARGQSLGAIETPGPRQLLLFPAENEAAGSGRLPLFSTHLAELLGGRSNLYAHFLVQATAFVREGGRLAFVVPNAWLDTAYGLALKQFLLDHFRLQAIVESSVERWFDAARINTCLLLLEKCGNPQRRRNNLVHLARLQQPLHALLPPADDYRRFIESEQVVRRLLPGHSLSTAEAVVQVVTQKTLRPADKWGIALRMPAFLRKTHERPSLAPLERWAALERGYTTGANEFFYLTPQAIAQWEIEPQFRLPLLKSLRGRDRLRLDREDSRLQVLLIPPDAALHGTAVAEYIAWGAAQGFGQRTTCAARPVWYSLDKQEASPLVLPKGVWQRHAAPLLLGGLAVDQQLYQVYPAPDVSLLAAAALLNSAWFALQAELHGRVSFGKGLLWLAAYELEQVPLPDPRHLALGTLAQLEEAILPLLNRTHADSLAELDEPDRRHLDSIVFDVLGLEDEERTAVLAALRERLVSRRQRAQSNA